MSEEIVVKFAKAVANFENAMEEFMGFEAKLVIKEEILKSKNKKDLNKYAEYLNEWAKTLKGAK